VSKFVLPDLEEFTSEELEEMTRISDEIVREIRIEEAWLKKLRGCTPATACSISSGYTLDIFRSEICHKQARLEHFRRVRGFNA
jgi:hypothetical protein